MKRHASFVLCLAMVAAGCANGSPSTVPGTAGSSAPSTGVAATAPPEPVVLQYVTGLLESAEAEAQVDTEIAEFEAAHPEIQINRQAVDYEQMQTLIQTRIQSGDVDIFQLDSGPAFGGSLARAGLLADLGPAFKQYGWAPFDWALDRCTYGGVVRCYPDGVDELGIFYNKTMFDEHGFTEPRTLDQLIAIMDALRGEGITPLAFGNQPQWPAGHLWSMVLSNMVGSDGLDARLYGESPWNDAAVVDSIDLVFRQFLDAGYYPKDPNAISYEDAADLFYSGQAAMFPTGSWLVYDVVDQVEFEPGFMPFPSIGGSPIAPASGVGSAIGVAATSTKQDAALTFIDWIHSDEVLRTWTLGVNKVIPAQQIDATGVDIPPMLARILADLSGGEGAPMDFGYNIDVLTPGAFTDQLYVGFQEVLGGGLTPDEQADRLQQIYQDALAAGETIER